MGDELRLRQKTQKRGKGEKVKDGKRAKRKRKAEGAGERKMANIKTIRPLC